MYTRPRIIPTLLVNDRDLVKTVQFGKQTYLGDPVNAVKIFNRKYVDELSVLDISASRESKGPDFELLKDIASEAFMPLSYGGGLTTLDQVREIFAIGYEKAIFNTSLVRNPSLIKSAVEAFGGQSIVASIDAKKTGESYWCAIRDGQEVVDMTPVALACEAEELGVGEIIINSIDQDGMMSGYDIALVRQVADAVKVPVVAIGGASGVADMKKALDEGHAHATAGGSMFVYYGKLKAVLITAPSEEELLAAGVYA